jgi:sarcosine dehydrogenase
VGREHRAAREAAVIFDQSSFAKFILKGPDAEDALSWICANNVAKPVGSLTYTQMLNDKGGIECDLTVARTAHDEFYIVTGTGFATHDFDWIRRNIPEGMNAQLFDVTSANAVLSLMGPKARDILQAVTRDDVATRPSGSARHGASASPAARCWRCASPTSASSAGSCTCRPSTPSTSTRR